MQLRKMFKWFRLFTQTNLRDSIYLLDSDKEKNNNNRHSLVVQIDLRESKTYNVNSNSSRRGLTLVKKKR